jgi:hypothetical protein
MSYRTLVCGRVHGTTSSSYAGGRMHVRTAAPVHRRPLLRGSACLSAPTNCSGWLHLHVVL